MIGIAADEREAKALKVLRNWGILFAVVLYFGWLWIRVLFSCLYSGFMVGDGITFAFFVISTAGLEPPGDTRTVGLLFITDNMIVGVPSSMPWPAVYLQVFYIKNKQMSQWLLDELAICQ